MHIDLPLKFKQAIMACQLSDHAKVKMGAAIFIKSRFIASGHNSKKTHPSIKLNRAKGMHAEIHAISKAKSKRFDLSDTTIFVYRETKEGYIAMAKPCKMCMEFLMREGFKHIYLLY